MQYKTIVLGLLKDRPELYEHLQRAHLLLATMEDLSIQLKIRHQRWIRQLTPADLEAAPSQPRAINSQAMELALKELEDRLLSWQAPAEFPSLEQAMAFIKRHTSNA